MSKSKRNVVDPAHIIATYGADTARLFMLSDSPPERDLEWTESGIDGAWRYVNRLWRLAAHPALPLPPVGADKPKSITGKALAARSLIHRSIAHVDDDLERFQFNKAVARIREMTNALGEFNGSDKDGDGAAWVLREGLETAALLIGPMMPHLAEEVWSILGHSTLLAQSAWPKADPSLLVDDTVTIAIQVNGKLRATLDMPKDSPSETVEALALQQPQVISILAGKPPRKVVVVPNRIVNVVA
jgi:leucyl-tRNA synthetase